MSKDPLKAFLEKVKAHSLQEKLKAAANADAGLAIAKEAGLILSGENLKKSQFNRSEEELEGVTGHLTSVQIYSY